jgi:hypothetical protein
VDTHSDKQTNTVMAELFNPPKGNCAKRAYLRHVKSGVCAFQISESGAIPDAKSMAEQPCFITI